MNLVYEENFAFLQIRKERRKVSAALNRRSAHALHGRVHLCGDDVSQRGLAQARRPAKQNVIERLAPCRCGLYENLQIASDLRLAYVLAQAARAKTGLGYTIFGCCLAGN